MVDRTVTGEVIPTPRGKDIPSIYTWATALCTVLTRRFAQGDRDLESGLGEAAGLTQVEGGHWFIPEAENKTYVVIQKTPYAFTITETTTKSVSGTCTVTFRINGTNIGGTANSASSSEQSQSHTSSNAVAEGDTVDFVVTSNSSCLDLAISMAVTRELAP